MTFNNKLKYYAAWAETIIKVFRAALDAFNNLDFPKKEDYE
jgi:hypothetical protein